MRTIVHLSDLHFGHLDERIIAPLVDRISAVAPDLIAVSGDMTQRARTRQFQQACAFLDSTSVSERSSCRAITTCRCSTSPHASSIRFGGYRRHISPDLEPAHIDDEMAVIGSQQRSRA